MNREIYQKQNFGNQIGYGLNPALLIVDFTNSFADPAILGGGNITDAIQNTKVVLDLFRNKQLPVFYTKVILDREIDASLLFAQKKQASAFFNTNLQQLLNELNIDTLIITGCTTSGCVRASVVDCISYNIRPMVVEDCVGDRSAESHELSLFEINSKYGDIVNSNDVIQYITKINK